MLCFTAISRCCISRSNFCAVPLRSKESVPQNEGYYLDLVNLLLQQGNTEEAIQTAGVGVSRIPRSSALIIKKASILAEEARYQEAMAFVKSRMRTNRDGHLVRFYNLLLAEAAISACRR